MKSWGLVCLGALFALAGCGKPGVDPQGLPTFKVPPLDKDREKFLQTFPLIDEHDQEAPPFDPVTKKSPFGVLVHMPSSGYGKFCSLAHASPGVVTTNAHCVVQDPSIANYFVVYYDRQGEKRFSRVESFDYVGNVDADDIAILRISSDAKESWDTIGGKAVQSAAEVGKRIPVLHKVVLWSFNPIKGNHPELEKEYGPVGMRFTPRTCDASRSEPRLKGIITDEAGEVTRKVNIQANRGDLKLHWFVDHCNIRPIKGNSGSLFTEASDISRPLGVFHWVIPYDEVGMSKYHHFEYAGNDNVHHEISTEEARANDLFGVGTDFSYILGLRPGLL